ncbi:MAG: hypothetical protein JST80_00275 [Bdellovibrionales bacterium]|nr:hypothetical protein [Bdellovibrionales bacterium]
MLIPFRAFLFVIALVTGVITSYTVFAEELVFDRLDGHGPSGKRVDVIEWEGNLEVHVYPKGSLKGLSVKLDDREKGKKVMVIGYRFDADKNAHPLVRRAILGVPFNANLKAFIDRSEPEFDKLAISNNGLAKPWENYQLDPAVKQWYPDGVEDRNEENNAQPFLGSKSIPENNTRPANTVRTTGDTVKGQQRAPASVISDDDFGDMRETDQKAQDKEGRIKNFSW